MGCLSSFTGAAVGAILGGIAGFLLPPAYLELTNPRVLQDGQWGMVYLLTLPLGIVLGATIGGVFAYLKRRS